MVSYFCTVNLAVEFAASAIFEAPVIPSTANIPELSSTKANVAHLRVFRLVPPFHWPFVAKLWPFVARIPTEFRIVFRIWIFAGDGGGVWPGWVLGVSWLVLQFSIILFRHCHFQVFHLLSGWRLFLFCLVFRIRHKDNSLLYITDFINN